MHLNIMGYTGYMIALQYLSLKAHFLNNLLWKVNQHAIHPKSLKKMQKNVYQFTLVKHPYIAHHSNSENMIRFKDSASFCYNFHIHSADLQPPTQMLLRFHHMFLWGRNAGRNPQSVCVGGQQISGWSEKLGFLKDSTSTDTKVSFSSFLTTANRQIQKQNWGLQPCIFQR